MTDTAALPCPTEDLETAKGDLEEFGYCLLASAMSPSDLVRVRARLIDQAAAEKRIGEAFEDGGPAQQWGTFRDEDGRLRPDAFTEAGGGVNQRLWMLVNKGEEFLGLLEDERVLALVRHVLGDALLLSSFTANIARPGGVKMNLHTDQWWMPEPAHRNRQGLPVGSMTRTRLAGDGSGVTIAPAACANVIWMLDDFTEANGATRLVPRSHRRGRHPDPELDADVVTVGAVAPAGTALVTDGRVWHGTGANVGNSARHAVLTTFCGPQFRPQENYTVGTCDEVLETATPALRELLGFRVWCGYGRTHQPTTDFIDRREQPLGRLGPP